MFDMRPVGYLVGLMVMAMGLTMALPLLVDIAEGREHWPVFAESLIVTCIAGGLVALSCKNSMGQPLTIQQAFLLTTLVWVALPLFGALPFMLGETDLEFIDAYFEAMSGVTTTGATVIEGLDTLPKGLLLWRGILQWLGGLGIVIVALVFLPEMRVGGMQFFRAEGFDTFGKALPRTIDISKGVLNIYLLLTATCTLTYLALGMGAFDATVHALTTVSTGGFSSMDSSFAAFPGGPQYACVLFMVLASLPFVRMMQGVQGNLLPLYRDTQVRTYLRWIFYAVAMVVGYDFVMNGQFTEESLRLRLFNIVSIFTGTGYGDGDVTAWGTFPFVVLIVVGAIGGCTGSTGCSIKIFRYQLMMRAMGQQARRIFNPSSVMILRHEGRRVEDEVLQSVMLLFTVYILSLGFFSVALELTGLTLMESVTGAWTAIFNVGPAFGPSVGPTGSLIAFPDSAKALMILAMLMGRLEILAVIVLILPSFWRP
ncbi:potassium uptake transporter, transmembrane component, TrkH [Roseovarius sp. TM1035]|uniref:Trk system potassium uptake protein n=1 Tax=Roseovarius mucosus TaxID=215743 RepID=A0A1V0RLE5_9RHOB|nr:MULTISPECIES: TrkH family potassium uptake protein [Roseovarius]ARE82485.1 Trk system potassium uptake protein TrkI [Roseovarius mucosus]AWZ22563.1 Potassium uptake protein TrkH [Roseovarius sp. AK1035]EDM32294.1 potassium uptake transporter, transmembrane component, TrkH [Roseovarius sp. TM1035]